MGACDNLLWQLGGRGKAGCGNQLWQLFGRRRRAVVTSYGSGGGKTVVTSACRLSARLTGCPRSFPQPLHGGCQPGVQRCHFVGRRSRVRFLCQPQRRFHFITPSVSQSVSQPVNQSVRLSGNQPASQSTSQLASQSACQSVSQSVISQSVY